MSVRQILKARSDPLHRAGRAQSGGGPCLPRGGGVAAGARVDPADARGDDACILDQASAAQLKHATRGAVLRARRVMRIEFPGLFDLQVNGFAGVDFNAPDLTADASAWRWSGCARLA